MFQLDKFLFDCFRSRVFNILTCQMTINSVSMMHKMSEKRKFNLFLLFVNLIHRISFTESPISERYLECCVLNTREQNRTKKPGRNEISDSALGSTMRGFLCKPLELLKTIKRYHQCGNYFMIYLCVHLMLLIHLSTKSIIQSQTIWSNATYLKENDAYYYPYMTSKTRNPYLFINLFVALCVGPTILRVRSVYLLIKRSIKNSRSYQELRISQLNLAYLTTFYLTAEDWLKLGKVCLSQSLDLFYNKKLKNQLPVHKKVIESDRLHGTARRDLLHRVNVLNFGHCFYAKSLELDLKDREESYMDWFCMRPIYKMDFDGITIIYLGWLIFVTCCSILPFVTLYTIMAMELSSLAREHSLPGANSLSPFEIIFTREIYTLITFKDFIRISEIISIAICQAPCHFDSIQVAIDLIVVMSRIQFARKSLEQDHNHCLREAVGQMDTRDDSSIYRSNHGIYNQKSNMDLKSEEFNKNLRNHLEISSLIHLEFLEIRSNHASLLDMLIVICFLCIAYCISISAKASSGVEMLLIIMSGVSFSIPSTLTIMLITILEKKVSS